MSKVVLHRILVVVIGLELAWILFVTTAECRSRTTVRGVDVVSISAARRRQYNPHLDPTQGSLVPELREVKDAANSKCVAVMFVEDLHACAVTPTVRSWVALQGEFPGVRFLIVTPDRGLTEDALCAQLGQERDEVLSMLHLDKGRRLFQALNAGWTPRTYLLGADHRMTYIQPDSADSGQSLDSLRDRLKASCK